MTAEESSPQSPAPFKVLVLGGSYGGLTAALDMVQLGEGKSPTTYLEYPSKCHVPVEVTVVDERDGFFHVVGAPLALIESTYSTEAWTRFTDIKALAEHPNLHIYHGSVKWIDCVKKTASVNCHGDASGIELQYDYLICATGYRRKWPAVPQSLERKTYLDEASGHIDLVKSAEHGVAVIGGGAVGIEMAAETKMCYPDIKVTLFHSRDRLLSAEPLPDEFAEETLKLLQKGGAEVVLGKRVVDVTDDGQTGATKKTLRLSDNTTMTASHVITAISTPTPTSTYLPYTALDVDGLVKVEASLHFATYAGSVDTHLAVGDIAAWPPTGTPTIKRCGGAIYMGHVAALNVYKHMLYRLDLAKVPEYTTVPVFPPAIAVALGKNAVGYWEGAGVTEGDELRDRMFGNDLGLDICWQGMGLGSFYADAGAKEPLV